jgi:hypothetical protein
MLSIPIIPATWETEIGRSQVRLAWEKNHEILSEKMLKNQKD